MTASAVSALENGTLSSPNRSRLAICGSQRCMIGSVHNENDSSGDVPSAAACASALSQAEAIKLDRPL